MNQFVVVQFSSAGKQNYPPPTDSPTIIILISIIRDNCMACWLYSGQQNTANPVFSAETWS